MNYIERLCITEAICSEISMSIELLILCKISKIIITFYRSDYVFSYTNKCIILYKHNIYGVNVDGKFIHFNHILICIVESAKIRVV